MEELRDQVQARGLLGSEACSQCPQKDQSR